jgi:hypothetical protein
MNWVASTIGACVVAAFLIGALLGSELLRKRQNPQGNQSHADRLDYPGGADKQTSIATLARAHIAFAKDASSADKRQSSHSERIYRINFWIAFWAFAYTIFTAAILVFSIVQYGETHRFNKKQKRFMNGQLEVAQKTLVMSERPWLYINGNIDYVQQIRNNNRSVITFNMDITNQGNAIATYIETNGIFVSRQNMFGYTTDFNIKDSPCNVRVDFMGFAREKGAIPPRRHQQMGFDVEFSGNMDVFEIERNRSPFLLGCIQYKWPITNEIFRTYFAVGIRVIDAKTKEMVGPYSIPNSLDGGLRPVGEISYIDAN